MPEILRNILLGITLAAPIGPSGVAIIQNGLRGGFPRAFLTGVGVTLADTTYLLVVFFGLSGFMGIPLVKVLVWSFGALVLFYLGAVSIRDSRGEPRRKISLEGEITSPPAPAAVADTAATDTAAADTPAAYNANRSPLLVGYLVNISNPIAVVFWLGIYGSLLGAASHNSSQLQALLLSSTILIGILMWHSTVSLLTHWGRRILSDRLIRFISLFAGVVLLLFGLRFAWNAIQTTLQMIAS